MNLVIRILNAVADTQIPRKYIFTAKTMPDKFQKIIDRLKLSLEESNQQGKQYRSRREDSQKTRVNNLALATWVG